MTSTTEYKGFTVLDDDNPTGEAGNMIQDNWKQMIDRLDTIPAAGGVFVESDTASTLRATTIGDGGATNYAAFAADGELTLAGTARVKKAIDMAGATFEQGGTAPDAVVVGNYLAWSYDVGDDSVLTFELPHDWAVGTDLTISIDWGCAEGDAADEVQWNITWSAIPHDNTEALTAAGTVLDPGDVSCTAVADYLVRSVIGTIDGGDLAAEDEIGLKIERVAAIGTDPAADPYITHVYIEYIADKLGEAM